MVASGHATSLHASTLTPNPACAKVRETGLVEYMSFKDILDTQRDGMRASANVGVIGLHLVSGPLVGFAIGYALDAWLNTSPWCKLIFLLIGICAGFLNVWRDTKSLLKKMDADSGHSTHQDYK